MSDKNDELMDQFIEGTLKAIVYVGWFLGAGVISLVVKLFQFILDSPNNGGENNNWGNKPDFKKCPRCGGQCDAQLTHCLSCGSELSNRDSF